MKAFENRELARAAGSKGGKAVASSKRYFSVNRQAAKAAAKKSNHGRSRAPSKLPESVTEEEFASLVPRGALEL